MEGHPSDPHGHATSDMSTECDETGPVSNDPLQLAPAPAVEDPGRPQVHVELGEARAVASLRPCMQHMPALPGAVDDTYLWPSAAARGGIL